MVNIVPLPPAGPNNDDDDPADPAEESAGQFAADIIDAAEAAVEAAAVEAAAAEDAIAADDQIPPEHETAAARALSEFNGNRFILQGQR